VDVVLLHLGKTVDLTNHDRRKGSVGDDAETLRPIQYEAT
jgi:hypothetical protein